MRREILFKAKSINTGEWVESMTVARGTIKRKSDNFYLEVDEKWVGIDPKTLCEFTGKTIPIEHPMFYDVIKVFEDDIFSFGDSKERYRVVFRGFEWIGISIHGDDFGPFTIRLSAVKDKMIIHGNYNDNPDLLNY